MNGLFLFVIPAYERESIIKYKMDSVLRLGSGQVLSIVITKHKKPFKCFDRLSTNGFFLSLVFVSVVPAKNYRFLAVLAYFFPPRYHSPSEDIDIGEALLF